MVLVKELSSPGFKRAEQAKAFEVLLGGLQLVTHSKAFQKRLQFQVSGQKVLFSFLQIFFVVHHTIPVFSLHEDPTSLRLALVGTCPPFHRF